MAAPQPDHPPAAASSSRSPGRGAPTAKAASPAVPLGARGPRASPSPQGAGAGDPNLGGPPRRPTQPTLLSSKAFWFWSHFPAWGGVRPAPPPPGLRCRLLPRPPSRAPPAAQRATDPPSTSPAGPTGSQYFCLHPQPQPHPNASRRLSRSPPVLGGGGGPCVFCTVEGSKRESDLPRVTREYCLWPKHFRQVDCGERSNINNKKKDSTEKDRL